MESPLVDAYFAALNAEEWERLASLFAPEATLHAPSGPTRTGREAIGLYFAALLSPYVAHLHEVVRAHDAGGVVTAEVHVRGELANGEAVEFDAVEIFDTSDNVISHLRRLHDSQRLRGKLALALAASPPINAANGSLSQLTPARLRAALALVRRGESFRLDGDWADGATGPACWSLPPRAGDGARHRLDVGIQARAVILDICADLDEPSGTDLVLGAADLVAAADERGVEIRSGDVVLLRAGSADRDGGVLLADREMGDWLAAIAPSGICIDRPALFRGADASDGAADLIMREELGLLVGVDWSLKAICADCALDDVWEALLISLPTRIEGDERYAANAVVIK